MRRKGVDRRKTWGRVTKVVREVVRLWRMGRPLAAFSMIALETHMVSEQLISCVL